MIQNSEFDEVLRKSWSNRYENQRILFRSTLKFIHMRQIEDTKLKAYFNLQMIENKIASQIRYPDTEIIKDFNDEDDNFLFIEDGEILFYADLENNKIILKETQNTELDHPVLINQVPLCSFHSLIVPFLNQKLTQVLSGHIIGIVLNIFNMSQSPSLRLGYNSILGNCSINHLHLHLIYADQLFESNQFPIETYEIKVIFEKEQTLLGELIDYPIRTLVVKGKQMAGILSLILDNLLQNGIPHNILFVSPELAYVFPRKSQFEFFHDHTMKPGFIELAGLIVCRNKQFYDEVDLKSIKEKYALLSHPEFDQIIKDVKEIQTQE